MLLGYGVDEHDLHQAAQDKSHSFKSIWILRHGGTCYSVLSRCRDGQQIHVLLVKD